MSILTEKQIKYGHNYFHKDEPDKRCIVEVSDYKGEKELIINCTPFINRPKICYN